MYHEENCEARVLVAREDSLSFGTFLCLVGGNRPQVTQTFTHSSGVDTMRTDVMICIRYIYDITVVPLGTVSRLPT